MKSIERLKHLTETVFALRDAVKRLKRQREEYCDELRKVEDEVGTIPATLIHVQFERVKRAEAQLAEVQTKKPVFSSPTLRVEIPEHEPTHD